MKTYTIQVVIVEGNDEFWEDATKDGKTGCEDVLNMVKFDLESQGFEFFDGNRYGNSIRIVKFEDK